MRWFRVGCSCKEATDTDSCTWHTDWKRGFDSRIDVAVDFAVPPGARVIIGPDDGVDKKEEVDNEDPADEDKGRPWTPGNFPVEIEKWNANEKPDARENSEAVVRHVDTWKVGK